MANLSDAEGWFTIESKDEGAVKALIYLMLFLDTNGEYCTYFRDFLKSNDDHLYDSVYKTEEGVYTFSTTFAGVGRWTYETNIEKMMCWINYEVEYSNDENGKKAIIYLIDHDYSITFDFTDYECGCEVFYHAITRVEHHAGKPFKEVSITDLENNDIELTIVNFAEYIGLPFNEVMAELYLWGENLEDQDEERQEFIKDILNEQKEDIERFFGASLDDLIKTI